MDLRRQGNRSAIFAGLAIAFLVALPMHAAAQWSNPVTVSTNAAADGGFPEVAATDEGFYIITWNQAVGGAAHFARSENRGQTWGRTFAFAPPTGSITQGAPSIAADVTSGTFMAAWQVDFNFDGVADAAIARTTPDIDSFPTINLIGQFLGYFGMATPVIGSGGDNVWVVAGVSTAASAGDQALSLFRSIDDGLNWRSVGVLGQETTNIRFDQNADIAADSSGNWVLVTESRQGSPTSDDIFARSSRSTNQGETWTPLDEIDDTEPRGDRPRVSAGGAGSFIVLLKRGDTAGNMVTYRSTNSGGTWGNENIINLAGLNASVNILGHDIAADPEGNVVAVWSARDPMGGRNRLFFATSRDFGASWSPVDYMTTPTAGADVNDEWPAIKYDGAGRWAAAWQRRSFGTSTTLSIQSASLVFPIRADISVNQSHEPDPATVGEAVTYTVTVRNDGPSSASGVRLLDNLPIGAELLNVSQSQGTRSDTSDTISFDFGDINEGAQASADIEVRFNTSGVFSNVAEVTANEEDVDLEDRLSTESTRVLVEGVDLTGEWQKFIVDYPRRPFKGRLDVDSKLVVRNLGNQRARGFKVLLMFSTDNILSDDDAFAGVLNVPHLGPGNERKLDWEPKIRRYIPWHGRQLIAIIDAEMRVDEVDEFNNNIESGVIPVPEVP